MSEGEKQPKSIEEQLDILMGRGIVIANDSEYDKAYNIVKKVGYYKLINGYKKLFIDTFECKSQNIIESYKEGTSISEIYSLYYFDSELREIMLRHILPVETHIKSLLSLTISQHYGNDNYLRYQNFDTSRKGADKNIPDIIGDIYRQISARSSDPCIKHYLTEYGFLPIWVLNNILTFGQMSNLFRMLKQSDRSEVAREFKIQDSMLEDILRNLSTVRNISAHGNRLYCMRSKRPLMDTPVHANLKIDRLPGEYKYGKRDLFSSFIALKYLLSNNEYNKFMKEITKALSSLSRHLRTIDVHDVKEEMGLPSNWHDIRKKDIKYSKVE